ncbi:tRNA pseudouridine(38-40) synthase TruA [Nakamurella sp.]|uniref:tRNA pseudouridine(38-40) synthase TruA n=1 Tax=Nakamurella sp. TaxID=1869182 RepID=UPI00378304FA
MPDPAASSRLRLDISYDGTDFAGWAVQPGLRTVAGVLAGALRTLLRHEVRLVVAGRTDAGVHATGQVAHVDVDLAALRALAPRDHTDDQDATGAGRLGMLRRLAGLLPPDLRVRAVTAAPNGFDARFSALRRHYRYRIGTAAWGVEPADRRFVLARRRSLDVGAMTVAAQALVGLHDFHAFCRPREGATTIRDLQALDVRSIGDEVRIDVTADAFCHSMVRALVGSLLVVGELRSPAARPGELLAARERTSAIPVVPPHGLTLRQVDYPSDRELADRSNATRALRTL